MFKQIEKTPKSKSRRIAGDAYVRLTNKMLYINEEAARMLQSEHIQLFVDTKRQVLRIAPCAGDDEHAFKLSRVKESKHAQRIETNNALLSLIGGGFPMHKLGQRLPASMSLDGAMLVDFAYHPAPVDVRARAAEGGAGHA